MEAPALLSSALACFAYSCDAGTCLEAGRSTRRALADQLRRFGDGKPAPSGDWAVTLSDLLDPEPADPITWEP